MRKTILIISLCVLLIGIAIAMNTQPREDTSLRGSIFLRTSLQNETAFLHSVVIQAETKGFDNIQWIADANGEIVKAIVW